MLKAQETERDMHNLHTFKRRLGWFYTWRQQARKGKNQKIRRKCATVAPYLAASRHRRSCASTSSPLHQRWRGEEVRPTTTATTLLAQPCGCSQQAGAGIAITLPPPEKRSRISEG